MTAPDDPFRSPDAGADRPPATPPTGDAPVNPYGPGQTAQPFGQPPPYGGHYGAGQYGAPVRPPYGSTGPGTAPSNGLGVAALVLGIAAVVTGLFLLGGVLGVVAIVLGVLARKKAARGEADNGGTALAGIVLGAVGILVAAVVVVVAGVLFSRADLGSFTECLSQADGDQAAVDACSRDFERDLTGDSR